MALSPFLVPFSPIISTMLGLTGHCYFLLVSLTSFQSLAINSLRAGNTKSCFLVSTKKLCCEDPRVGSSVKRFPEPVSSWSYHSLFWRQLPLCCPRMARECHLDKVRIYLCHPLPPLEGSSQLELCSLWYLSNSKLYLSNLKGTGLWSLNPGPL